MKGLEESKKESNTLGKLVCEEALESTDLASESPTFDVPSLRGTSAEALFPGDRFPSFLASGLKTFESCLGQVMPDVVWVRHISCTLWQTPSAHVRQSGMITVSHTAHVSGSACRRDQHFWSDAHLLRFVDSAAYSWQSWHALFCLQARTWRTTSAPQTSTAPRSFHEACQARMHDLT